MNANIINLAARKKVIEAEKQVKSLIGLLNSVYSHLNEAYEQISVMETQCDKIQELYDTTLKEYIDTVGADKVPLEYLNYTTSVEVEIVNGRVVLRWRENDKV